MASSKLVIPFDILSDIFTRLHFDDAIRASSVCKRWYQAAIWTSELWLCINIHNNDVRDADHSSKIVHRILARSKGRPISLELVFEEPLPEEEPAIYVVLEQLLRFAIKPYLAQCSWLRVHAGEEAWSTILAVFAGVSFPLLLNVDLANLGAGKMWQSELLQWTEYSDDEDEGENEEPLPPKDLIFPLPSSLLLRCVELQGVSFGPVALPNLECLTVRNHLPDVLVDEELNPHLFTNNLRELVFDGLCLPGLEKGVSHSIAPTFGRNVEALILRSLCAPVVEELEEDGEIMELDCTPFFEAIDASSLRYLELQEWDGSSRIFDDFCMHLLDSPSKFRWVTHLTVCNMHLDNLDDSLVLRGFLAAFPCLQKLGLLRLPNFFETHLPPLWYDFMCELEKDPGLCDGLTEIEIDYGVAARHDPFPFRNFMFLGFGIGNPPGALVPNEI